MEDHKVSHADAERKFHEDLETAKALSLELVALEKFKQDKLKQNVSLSISERVRDNGSSTVYSNVSIRRSSENRTSESSSLSIQIKPRPRPGGINVPVGSVIPPPLPKRQHASSEPDLINLKSPLNKNNPHDILLEELDQACLSHSNDVKTNTSNISCIPDKFDTNRPSHSISNSTKSLTSFLTSSKIGNVLLGKTSSKFTTTDLIDLGVSTNNTRFSILSAFDPLLNSNYQGESDEIAVSEASQISESITPKGEDNLSYIQDYDPFEYYLGVSQKESISCLSLNQNKRETIYEVLSKEQSPVRTSKTNSIKTALVKKESDLALKISVMQIKLGTSDGELTTFVEQICDLRKSFKCDDLETNLGYVVTFTYMHFFSSFFIIFPFLDQP